MKKIRKDEDLIIFKMMLEESKRFRYSFPLCSFIEEMRKKMGIDINAKNRID